MLLGSVPYNAFPKRITLPGVLGKDPFSLPVCRALSLTALCPVSVFLSAIPPFLSAPGCPELSTLPSSTLLSP